MPPDSRELRIWLPLPYEDRSQGISQLKIESPLRYKIQRDKDYGDRYAYVVVEADDARKPFDIKISFHVERFEHRVSFTPLVEPLGQPLVSPDRFLLPDRLVPIDGVIGELSDQQTKDATQPLDKARRIYDYVIATMHYDHDGTGWGRGDAVWACIRNTATAPIFTRFLLVWRVLPEFQLDSKSVFHCPQTQKQV